MGVVEIAEDPRVDVTGPGPHDEALERGQAHRRVDRPAAEDRRRAAAVAEVGDDDGEVGRVLPEQLGRPGADVAVTRAVEAVAAHAVLGIPGLGHGIPVGPGRHRLVERGVEHRDLRHVRPGVERRLDPEQAGRVVQGREGRELLDGVDDVLGDEDRVGEPLSAVDDAMPHADRVQRWLEPADRVDDGADRRPVGRAVERSLGAALGAVEPQPRLVAAEPLREAGEHPPPGSGVDEGELERRAPRVDDEDRRGWRLVGHGSSLCCRGRWSAAVPA